MKHLLTGLILLTWGCTAQAQTWETGLAINKTHLWQYESDYADRTQRLGISAMARYQNPNATHLLLKNNEIGFEHSRGELKIGYHRGERTNLKYSSTSFTLNNYFANFGTLKKGFQVSMGLHYNYKIHTLSDGGFTNVTYKRDSLGNAWTKSDYYSLDGRNNPFIRRFNMGPTIGIAFRPFQLGKLVLRSRYDISTTMLGEKDGEMNFNNLRQRFTLSVVWDKQK
jgi:hypothetical protein